MMDAGEHQQSHADFQRLTKTEAVGALQKELHHLVTACPPPQQEEAASNLQDFEQLFDRFITESTASVDWDKIDRLKDDELVQYSALQNPDSSQVRTLLNQLVVVKLNGGLGTSMGCQGPKSAIPVRSDLTFLDLTVQQIQHLNITYGSEVPLVLMNSFNTDQDTQKVLHKYQGFQIKTYTFCQARYPRLLQESLTPLPRSWDATTDMHGWYPPGHGDFYQAFHKSGLLQHFLDQGKQYVFVSNIDNLGATVDLRLLQFLLGGAQPAHCPFLMEVTDKTRADIKGGTLIRYEDKLRLLEIAQVPKEHTDDFKSVKTFKIFNTNNLWIKLSAMREVLVHSRLDMELIINNKTLHNGLNIVQLEQAVGAAIKSFPHALGINVPRSRFLPVKRTDDLLLVMSNLYSLQQGALVMSTRRQFDTTPLVKLGSTHFGKIKEFWKRFGTVPDMLELDHLAVSGDVTFGRGVVLKGTVIIIANHGSRINIPTGSVLENKIVSGNLRILAH